MSTLYRRAVNYAKKHYETGTPEFDVAITAFMDSNKAEKTIYIVDRIRLFYHNGQVNYKLKKTISTDDRGYLTNLIKTITKSKGAILYGRKSQS